MLVLAVWLGLMLVSCVGVEVNGGKRGLKGQVDSVWMDGD